MQKFRTLLSGRKATTSEREKKERERMPSTMVTTSSAQRRSDQHEDEAKQNFTSIEKKMTVGEWKFQFLLDGFLSKLLILLTGILRMVNSDVIVDKVQENVFLFWRYISLDSVNTGKMIS